MEPLLAACRRWEVPLLEDAAEALGTTLGGTDQLGRAAGTLGDIGVFSFDGSKMITTSIGGMLVSHNARLVDHARKLASQAREPVVHYEHTEIGFNYRMSNLLAAFGREQLRVLPARVEARRQVFEWYRSRLEEIPGLTLQSEAPWGRHARWLTVAQIDPERTGADRETIRIRLCRQSIETRPVWKPMHQQPVYREMELPVLGGEVADELFERGLCLPSSSSLTEAEVERVCAAIREECSGG
jgi:pyridoxal phosphate-dependent aminotransferase EpsN